MRRGPDPTLTREEGPGQAPARSSGVRLPPRLPDLPPASCPGGGGALPGRGRPTRTRDLLSCRSVPLHPETRCLHDSEGAPHTPGQ